ncbi:hypothetical protein VIGAN_03026700 [Vigna angularis var. angularis]|uniref:GrpE protein homolog n=2 Tax=Phaseolus angularis TaxID=3914 RepID=A0A0S3RJK4_PHAAN|nr:grpE protein homolog 2, mitochondrial isoform X1 [Vigna angularis]BAT80671.1 hypothetical protein VIGAN_03026700 [Vigna angularis var. angularis]
MFVHKVLSRVSTTFSRTSFLSASKTPQHFSNHLHSLIHQSPNKLIPVQVNLSLLQISSSSTPRCGFSSSASSETNDKEKGKNMDIEDSTNDNPDKANEKANNFEQAGQAKSADKTEESSSILDSQSQTVKGRRRGFKRTAFSGSDSDSDSENEYLSKDDLIKLVAEKEELLKLKHKEIEQMQDKVLRTYADMENIMERTRRESENSKKFAVQNFAKSLLDVADNLGRASSVVKESFSKIDTPSDSAEAVKLLKTLLQGVEMTEKQLSEVLKKFGVEKFDPTNEPFDPHRHNAVFQIPDGSKPPGTVAAVLKAGYMLYDRVIRPAEVGVTQAVKED